MDSELQKTYDKLKKNQEVAFDTATSNQEKIENTWFDMPRKFYNGMVERWQGKPAEKVENPFLTQLNTAANANSALL